jgi:hypothetical protein
VEQTTRFSIVEHALADVVERLNELPQSGDAEKLRALAREYETQMDRWREQAPGEEQRAALLKGVLDLSVQVIRAGSRSQPPPPESPEDDEFPKAV